MVMRLDLVYEFRKDLMNGLQIITQKPFAIQVAVA